MEISIQQMLFEFLGGLGIFLFGIKFMGDGLQKSAGDRLRDLLDKLNGKQNYTLKYAYRYAVTINFKTFMNKAVIT